ncbi:MAG: hypothetical protein E3J44_00975 [Candidatus Aminicenantes bacterium]|nr:MAG: hypothetical protein E3J44_00975 [Candidatus Aminicenantes bacterium]
MKCPHCDTPNPEDSQFCIKCATSFTVSDETLIADPETIFLPRIKFKPETIFAGRYKIHEELGRGGMGVVYKAKDDKLKRFVALKFLPSALSSHKDAKVRFVLEAQTVSVLDHQNICTIHEIDETEDGQLYIAMAYYEGETLRQKIKRGAVPLADAIEIVIQVAQGLSKAHSEGIVHRDIKPANIIETSDRVIKIVDFGLAKLVSEAKLTLTSSITGTPAYMSPEQAMGESTDQHIDLWSLGVVFYELLTGYLPFQGENEQSMLYAIIHNTPKPPMDLKEDIPEEAERIVLKCLRKQPERRYQSADRLISDLTKLKISLEKEKEDLAAKKSLEAGRETERRQATIFSGEILGYSEVLESLETEEAALVINRCFAMFDSVIRKYESRIDETTGGSFMASFGIPQAIEDAPKKAINAAIELRNTLDTFNKKENLRIPLSIRIGVNSGTVIAGVGSTDKVYSVIGEAVNLASQLRDISTKNSIYIGPLTYRYTKNDFEFETLESVSLKGRTEPVTVFRLLSVKERVYRARLGAERMIYSEMVGREKELNKLKLHVLKAINGEGSVVNVIGEAGIGKSRLVAELSRRDELKKVTLLRGRALSIGSNLSFHPIIDILKSWALIKEEDPPDASAQKIEKVIRNVFPEGVSEIFPFIATLMGIKLTGKYAERVKGIEGDALEKLILKNFRDLIARASVTKPLVFVLEDLHWADLTSVDLFESLYRLAESNSILFINVLRPDYGTGERILRTIRNRYSDYSTEINLEPLDGSQSEALIGNLLNVEALPIRIRELIARRAEGNPFFIEEVARSFIDDGVVEIENGHFRVTEKIDSVVIPETINDVIMARVDKLEEQTKSLLKIASVIGRNFFYKILAEVARRVEEIDDRLEHLKEVQLIKERRRMKELEYLFKHALAWDAVYNSILLKKKKQLHLDVARSIESVFCERLHEFYGMLAFHYSRADEMEKAEEFLLKAGEEALKAAASNEALNYFQDAMELYLRKFGDAVSPEKIASLQKNIGMAFYYKGHFAESVEHFDKALEYWGLKRPKSEIKARFKLLIDLLWMMKEINFPSKKRKRTPGKEENDIMETSYRKVMALISIDTYRMFTEAIGLFRRVGKFNLTEMEHGLAFLSGFSALFSYSGVSLKIGKKILGYFKPYLDKCDDRTLFAYDFWKLVCEYLSGDWSKEQEFDEELIDTMMLKGETWHAPGYAGMLSFIKTELGDFRTAQKCCDKFQEIADLYEDDHHKARKSHYYTKLLLRSRKLYDVLDETEKMIHLNNKIGQRLSVIYLLGIRANAQILLKDLDGAESSLLQAAEPVSREKRISPLMISSYLTSQFLLNLCKLEKAIDSGDKSEIKQLRKKAFHFGKENLKNSKKFAAEQTKALRLMGVYFWLIGKQEKAITWWKRSITNGEELDARPELSRTYMEVGKRMSEVKSRIHQLNGISAEEYLGKARSLFVELGIESDLDELDVILSQRS